MWNWYRVDSKKQVCEWLDTHAQEARTAFIVADNGDYLADSSHYVIFYWKETLPK